jgi:hypothetical protein
MIARAMPWALVLLLAGAHASLGGQELTVNESPARPGEWGFRPADGKASPTNPPGFVWRPQQSAATYEVQLAREAGFQKVRYGAEGIRYNCHCPPAALEAATWYWRFRYAVRDGAKSAWSKARSFEIGRESVVFPMPARKELIGRIPKGHPRLFVRPGQLPHLRKLAAGPLKPQRDALVAECERLLRKPPPTEEPPKYPPGTQRLSEAWRKIWWGNRVYTIHVLNGAATLAFTRLITGQEEYGRLAKRLLLAAAEWDPKGATGYRYNDEAGMPYNYYFARTYSFVHDLLGEDERAACRKVMAIRGEEMYRHMADSHIWRPYGSHRNRAWHFLGEVGVAMLDEVPAAEEWVWFAMNVFYNAYPVWCDDDGGWHEGVSYWRSYIHRFTWWADVMRAAMDVDAYGQPYFSRIGYYAMYLQPPGTKGGGFGDLCATRRSSENRALMTILAAQARNPHWQWYVDAHGGPQGEGGYVGFIRGALPRVEPRPPDELPTSRVFRGTGQAMLNTNLKDARGNVEVIFKSSPFGTQSHGYESSNSFLLYAFGERLLIRTGRRDIHGSQHHRDWMWETKSTNCITVNGAGQIKNSPAALGEILAFHASDAIDYVAGEAAGAYPAGTLKRFTRHVVFFKPNLIVIYDRLEAPKPSRFEWHLHSPTAMKVAGQGDIRVVNGKAAARVALLAPKHLTLSLTDKFDPPPRARVKLTEWHLTARTNEPATRVEFVTLVRPHRAGKEPPTGAELSADRNRYELNAPCAGGQARLLLRSADAGDMHSSWLDTDADVAAVLHDRENKPLYQMIAKERTAGGRKAGPR